MGLPRCRYPGAGPTTKVLSFRATGARSRGGGSIRASKWPRRPPVLSTRMPEERPEATPVGDEERRVSRESALPPRHPISTR